MKYLLLLLASAFCVAAPPAAVETARPALTIELGDELGAVGFSPDGSLLATTSGEKTEVRLWDARTGALRAKLSGKDDPFQTLGGYKFPTRFLGGPSFFNFSPDGRLLAVVARMAREVRLWDVETRKLHLTLTSMNDVHQVEFSPDGGTLAIAAGLQGLILYDLRAGRMDTTRWDVKRVNGVYGVAFARDPSGLLVGLDADGKDKSGYYLFDRTTGKVRWMVPKPQDEDGQLSDDGRWLALVSRTGVRLLDANDGRPASVINVTRGKVYVAALSRDARAVATATDDKAVGIWDAGTGALKASLSLKETVALSFSPDGRLLVTAGADEMNVWDASNGAPKHRLVGARYPLAFSPDGRTLVTAGKGRTALIWQVPAD